MERVMLLFAIIILISSFATKISKKLNVPLLIIFLCIGMLFGSDGLGIIYFDNPNLAYVIATIALCFILFDGGLETQISAIKPVLKEGILLSVLGVLLNALLFSVPIYYITELSITESLLASATVASTDAAAVFFILKFNNINLKYNLRNILELESGSNDPMAYVLVLIFISVVNNPGNGSLINYILFFFIQMGLGFVMGIAFGICAKFILERLKLRIEELYSAAMIGILFFTFSVTNIINGNGFLAIYILGIILRSKKYLFKNSTIKFFSILSWLMQMILFVSLGLLVFPSELLKNTWWGISLALVLVLVIRPLSVFGSLMPFRKKIDIKSKIYISWGGLKGAVPIVFAIFVRTAGIDNSNVIFNLIFYIVVVSVLIQGATLNFGAKLLDLQVPENKRLKEKSEPEELEYLEDQLLELKISEDSNLVNKKIFEINFPEGALVTLVKRNSDYIHPTGQTKIHSGDKIIIMCKDKMEFINYIDELHKTYQETAPA
ncbi:MAG: potassium/proton antiporter [Victivallales bacterium]|nr:potassium/proton antiporter [Victivallales bacterium]